MRVPQYTLVEVGGRKPALSFHPVSKGIEIRVLDLAVGSFTCSAILLAPDIVILTNDSSDFFFPVWGIDPRAACMRGKLTLPLIYNPSPPGDFIAWEEEKSISPVTAGWRDRQQFGLLTIRSPSWWHTRSQAILRASGRNCHPML